MKTSLEQKKAALEAAGLDWNAFISLASSLGLKTEEEWQKGSVAEQVFANGYVKNVKLHRRFVMAHMFNLLFSENNWADKRNGSDINPRENFNKRVAQRGLNYSWKMVLNELKVQIKLLESDMECFEERNRVFDCAYVIREMVWHYMQKLEKELKRQRKNGLHKYKGQPYYTLGCRHYLVPEMDDMMKHLCDLSDIVVRKCAKSVEDLEKLLKDATEFYKAIPQFNRINQCPVWLSAFKGAGAFYTMQNMIRFHGCTIDGMDMKLSEKRLNEWAREYGKTGGYILFAKMIDFIEDNHFDFYKRMEEIHSK